MGPRLKRRCWNPVRPLGCETQLFVVSHNGIGKNLERQSQEVEIKLEVQQMGNIADSHDEL